MMEERSGGCLLEMLLAFLFAFVGALTGLGVAMPPPPDEGLTTVYTFSADARADDVQRAQAVLVMRLESLLAMGQIGRYESLGMTPDGEIQFAITAGFLEQGALLDSLTRVGRLELVDLSAVASDVVVEGAMIHTLFSGDVPVILTNRDIAAAIVVEDGFGGFAVQIDFTDEAAAIMGTFTESHIGVRLAIVIDGVVLSAPTIQARVDSTALISGNFTEADAQALAVQVSAPPLPVQLELVSVD